MIYMENEENNLKEEEEIPQEDILGDIKLPRKKRRPVKKDPLKNLKKFLFGGSTSGKRRGKRKKR